MHDYHKAKDMVEFAEAKAKELGKSKVTKIVVKMGEASGYAADSVCMYFKELSQGTVCEDAEVEIKTIKPMLDCPKCGEVFERRLMHYECPKCGEEGVPSKIGTQVEIESIETEA